MKKIFLITLIIMICFTLVGCGNSEETDTNIDKITERSEEVG